MRRRKLVIVFVVGVVVGTVVACAVLWIQPWPLGGTLNRPISWGRRFDRVGPSGINVLGVFGFGLALVLGVVKLWETFWQNPDLRLDFKWIWRPDEDADNPFELRIFASNVGRRKDSIREIGFAAARDAHPRFAAGSIRDALPVVLEPNVVVKFVLGVHPKHEQGVHAMFHQRLAAGEIAWAYLVDGRNHELWFELPTSGPEREVAV